MDNNTMKYLVIVNELKEAILNGSIKPGDKIASENQLCQKYNVSRHTVRKALSVLIDQEFLASEHGRGTFCIDRRRERYRSKNIGVVTTYVSDYIFPQVIKGIDSILNEYGYSIILKNTGNSQLMESRCLEDLMYKNIDGLIIEPSKSEVICRHENIFKEFEAKGIPVIFIQGRYLKMKDWPSVLMNDRQGGRLAAAHLLNTGHRHLAGIFKMDDYQGSERYKGFIEALNSHNITLEPDNIIWYHTEDRKTKPALILEELLNEGRTIDGIVCYNDQIALQIYHTLIKAGKKVPEDISIVGHDNSFIAENGPIPLTSVHHPKEILGEMAATAMLSRLGHHTDLGEEPFTGKKIIDPQLIIRRSTINRT